MDKVKKHTCEANNIKNKRRGTTSTVSENCTLPCPASSAHRRVRAAVGRAAAAAARRATRVCHLLLQLGEDARLCRVRDTKVLGDRGK